MNADFFPTKVYVGEDAVRCRRSYSHVVYQPIWEMWLAYVEAIETRRLIYWHIREEKNKTKVKSK